MRSQVINGKLDAHRRRAPAYERAHQRPARHPRLGRPARRRHDLERPACAPPRRSPRDKEFLAAAARRRPPRASASGSSTPTLRTRLHRHAAPASEQALRDLQAVANRRRGRALRPDRRRRRPARGDELPGLDRRQRRPATSPTLAVHAGPVGRRDGGQRQADPHGRDELDARGRRRRPTDLRDDVQRQVLVRDRPAARHAAARHPLRLAGRPVDGPLAARAAPRRALRRPVRPAAGGGPAARPAAVDAALPGAGGQPDRRAAAGAQQGRVRPGDRGVQRGPPGGRPHRRRAGRAALLRRDDVRQPGPPLADPGRPAHRSPRPAGARRGGPGPAGRAVPARPPGHPDAPQRREPAGARRRRLHPRAARAGRPDRRAARRAVRGRALHPHRVRHRSTGTSRSPRTRSTTWSTSSPSCSTTPPRSPRRTRSVMVEARRVGDRAVALRRGPRHRHHAGAAARPQRAARHAADGRRGRLPDDGPGRGRPAGRPARRQGRAAARPPSAAPIADVTLPTSRAGAAGARRPRRSSRRRCSPPAGAPAAGRRPAPPFGAPLALESGPARRRPRVRQPGHARRPAVRPGAAQRRRHARRRPADALDAGLVRPDRRDRRATARDAFDAATAQRSADRPAAAAARRRRRRGRVTGQQPADPAAAARQPGRRPYSPPPVSAPPGSAAPVSAVPAVRPAATPVSRTGCAGSGPPVSAPPAVRPAARRSAGPRAGLGLAGSASAVPRRRSAAQRGRARLGATRRRRPAPAAPPAWPPVAARRPGRGGPAGAGAARRRARHDDRAAAGRRDRASRPAAAGRRRSGASAGAPRRRRSRPDRRSSRRPQNRQRYADETMELPIFRELESAWFRTRRPGAGGRRDAAAATGSRAGAAAPAAHADRRQPRRDPAVRRGRRRRSAPSSRHRPGTTGNAPMADTPTAGGAPRDNGSTANGGTRPRLAERLPHRPAQPPTSGWQTAADDGWRGRRGGQPTAPVTDDHPDRPAQADADGPARAGRGREGRPPRCSGVPRRRSVVCSPRTTAACSAGVRNPRTNSTNPEATPGGQQSSQSGSGPVAGSGKGART